MRIDLDRFSFEIPNGFEDVTSYTFKDAGDQELLTVSFGTRPPEATNLVKLMALRRGNLEIVVPGAAKIEEESSIRVDGLPGRRLVYSFEDRGHKFRERWALALPTPDLYLQLSYVASAGDEKAGDRFDHICASVVPARRTAQAVPSPPGYTRRWARRMTLDVPTSLSPPRAYQFTAGEDGEVTVLLQYEDPAGHTGPLPFLEQDVAYDATQGILGKRETRPVSGDYGVGSMTSYSITPSGSTSNWAGLADLALKNGVRLRISIHGPAAQAVRLQTVITQFAQTLTLR